MSWRVSLRGYAPGLALCVVLASLAHWLAGQPWAREAGLGLLALAMLLGLLLGNTLYPRCAARADPGVALARQSLLRLGIVLYGVRLSLSQLLDLGPAVWLIDLLVVLSTFTLALWLGRRWLGLDRQTCLLIGAGSSICGAAAIVASESLVRGGQQRVAVAVATVVAFGSLAMLLYPQLFAWLGGDSQAFGIYIGSTLHEVAQVVAAGSAIDAPAAQLAVLSKMLRVLLLVPFLLLLAAWLRRAQCPGEGTARLPIPWFALGFLLVLLIQAQWPLARDWQAHLVALDDALLALAMAGLGLATPLRAVLQAGWRPLWLGGLLFVWLVLGGAAINALLLPLWR